MGKKAYSINCTNCAAPLDIYGGGRVVTVTCKYCKSVLDLNDDYKVLAKYQQRNTPKSDFSIGISGRIKNVEWTIIGMLSYKTTDFPIERWNEFFLYSPTHGYAWLVEEANNLYFSKRIRDFSIHDWQHDGKPKTIFYRGGHYLQKEAAYRTNIDYVEGELSWIAKVDESVLVWDYHGTRHQTISIERGNNEIEVSRVSRLKKNEIYESFGLAGKSEKPLPEYYDGITTEEIPSHYTLWISILSIILALMLALSFISDSPIFHHDASKTDTKQVIHVNKSRFLGKITIDSPVPLKNLSIKISKHNDNRPYFYIDKDKVFYAKKDFRNTWKIRSKSAIIYLKLDKGDYDIVLQYSQGVDIKIEEAVVRLRYIFPLLIIVLLYFVSTHDDLIPSKIPLIAIALVIIVYFAWDSYLFNYFFDEIVVGGLMLLGILSSIFGDAVDEYEEW